MPEANLAAFSLEGLSPQDLETERRRIVASLTTDYSGYDDPNIPRDLLQKLAVITAALRRKNAGPPKAAKAPKGEAKAKKTLDDVLGMI